VGKTAQLHSKFTLRPLSFNLKLALRDRWECRVGEIDGWMETREKDAMREKRPAACYRAATQ